MEEASTKGNSTTITKSSLAISKTQLFALYGAHGNTRNKRNEMVDMAKNEMISVAKQEMVGVTQKSLHKTATNNDFSIDVERISTESQASTMEEVTRERSQGAAQDGVSTDIIKVRDNVLDKLTKLNTKCL